MRFRNTKGRILFNCVNYLFFLLLTILCAYPVWYVLVQSLSGQLVGGKAILIPYQFTLENYQNVMQLSSVFSALGISLARTLAGTALTLLGCMLLGYLFSKPQMPFRKLLYRLLMITMYVSGGLVPSFLVMKTYGLLNTFWVYILPSMVSAYYVILIKTFVEQLPAAVEESAMLDGAGTLTIFFRIVLPMSKPIVATIALYASVAQWNAWFDNHIYNFTNDSLTTLQYLLYNYLNEAERLADMIEKSSTEVVAETLSPKSIRMTVTVVAIIPVMLFYPFVQRYFVKGINMGAVKG